MLQNDNEIASDDNEIASDDNEIASDDNDDNLSNIIMDQDIIHTCHTCTISASAISPAK